MKSFAIAAVSALVSIVVATHPSVLDDVLRSSGLSNPTNGELAHLILPAGIEITASTGPKAPPPSGRTKTWHPAHPGVNIDGCDAQDKDWHYVHPCQTCQEEHHTWTTSTVTAIVTKTVVDCAPSVVNCPARITAVTTITTSICPATNTAAAPSVSNITVTAAPSPVSTVEATAVPVTDSPVSSVEVTDVESPCAATTTAAAAAPPAKSPVQVWTTAPAPAAQPTKAPVSPPASVAPPVRPGNNNNNTQAQPPVIVNGGAQAQIGLFAAVAAVAALL